MSAHAIQWNSLSDIAITGRASYHVTPATDSMSMPPGRASYSARPTPGRASHIILQAAEGTH
eukprot:990952-Rhodomonas_salina.2